MRQKQDFSDSDESDHKNFDEVQKQLKQQTMTQSKTPTRAKSKTNELSSLSKSNKMDETKFENISDNRSAISQGYQAPSNVYLRSEGQVKLDIWLQRFKDDHLSNTNLRSKNNNPDYFDENEESGAYYPNTGYPSPCDAVNVPTIQSLDDYIKRAKRFNSNPRKTFFQLSADYYTARYKEENRKTITVSSYVDLKNSDNFVRDLQLEIIQTSQGCMPIVKTYEYDVYNKNKFQKALKFYNYREEGVRDCPLLKQIVVDESVMHDNFRCWDSSILYYGNFIIFYKREFGNKRFKLQSYDVTINDLQEIKGYEIEETQELGSGTESRVHPIFSMEFGKVRNPSDVIKQQKDQDSGFDDFLRDKMVILQNYSIHKDGSLVNDEVQMFRMTKCKDPTDSINSKELRAQNPDFLETRTINGTDSKIQWAANKSADYFTREAIQYVCHFINPKTKEIKFIAIDPFNSYHFTLNGNTAGPVETYTGNNEQQMFQHDEIKLWFSQETNEVYMEQDEYGDIPFKERYEARYTDFCPFFKHQNPQYLIQKESIFIESKQEYVDHFFNTTADNQYMLLYPNYHDQHTKKEVLFQIAQSHCYKSNPDEEYNYIDDYTTRRKDYLNSIYKRISHVCAEDWRSKNHIKRAEHIDNILQYSKQHGKKFNIYDKIILSTDQERSNIYVYQSAIVTGQNKIEIYNYENNIAYSEKAKEVPIEIAYIMKDQELERDHNDKNIPPHHSYYINGRSQNVVSCSTQIRARMASIKSYNNESDIVNHRIENNDKQEFMIVETTSGLYKNIRIKQAHNEEKIRLEMYNIGRTGYTFFFSLVNDRHGNKKHNYFTISKSFQDINDILGNDNNQSIIQMDTECHVFRANDFYGSEAKILKKYTQVMSFKQLLDMTKLPQEDWIHLTFEKIFDNISKNDFFPIIFQQLKGNRCTQFLLFDVNKMEVVRQTSVLQNVDSKNSLIKNSFGFAKFTITRTSDFFQDTFPKFTTHFHHYDRIAQNAKYQISVGIYLKDPGSVVHNPFSKQENTARCTVELQEFFVRFRCCGDCHIKLIGRKQMLLSQVAQLKRKESFQDLYFFPYFDRMGRIKGTTLVMEQPEQQKLKQMEANEARFKQHETSKSPNRASFKQIGKESIRGSVKLNKSVMSDAKSIDGTSCLLDDYGLYDGQEEEFICIHIKDQNVSNIYHQNSDLVQFGHQKFLINANTHEEYILLVSSQFKQKVYMKGNFENAESNYIHRKIQKKLLSMQLAKFEYFVLNDDFEALLRSEFYQPQEVLEGKTINDLCLNFPREVNYGLWQLDGANAYGGQHANDKTKWQSIAGSLAEEVCESNEDRMNNLIQIGLAEKNLIIQTDFNFTTSLRIAMELNANQTVKILIEKVFDINDRNYQELIMIDLPTFLQYPRIERFYPFLERDYEEASQIIKLQKAVLGSGKKQLRDTFCNFEDFLNNPDLPEFYGEKITYHLVERYMDYENRDDEIVYDINHHIKLSESPAPVAIDFQEEDKSSQNESFEKEGGKFDKLMFWKGKKINSFMDGKEHSCLFGAEFEKKNIEVEHSCIDFTILIIGEKIRGVLEENRWNKQFNDEALADMIYIEDDEHIEFYNLDIVRKLIDYQFNQKTKPFLSFMFKFYVFGFVIPFILTMTIEWVLILNILYSICLFVQLFFISFEWIQLKQQHWMYFTDPFNVNDFSQFALFSYVYFYKMLTQFEGDNLVSMYLQAIILFQCFYKSFYFLRIYDSYMFLLNMTYRLFNVLFHFFLFITFTFIALCKIEQSLGFGVHDPDHEYRDIPGKALRLMFQDYRSANGQKVIPTLDLKLSAQLDNAPFFFVIMLVLATTFWLFQNAFFLYYATHFMALLFHGYEEINPKMIMLAYRSKARFNSENFPVLQMFMQQRTFKTVCFAIDKHQVVELDEAYEGVVKMGQKGAIKREGQRLQKKKIDDAELTKLKRKQDVSLQHIEQLRKNNAESKQVLDQLIQISGSIYDRLCCCEQPGGVNYR